MRKETNTIVALHLGVSFQLIAILLDIFVVFEKMSKIDGKVDVGMEWEMKLTFL